MPQVMLEIHCAGPLCGGALIASVSATKGAVFFRVPRDDAYIAEMLRLLRRFHERYVDTNTDLAHTHTRPAFSYASSSYSKERETMRARVRRASLSGKRERPSKRKRKAPFLSLSLFLDL